MNPGSIVFIFVCVGCSITFFGIGIWAWRRESPVHFWSGTDIAPASISDIPAYNRDNGIMWIKYSLSYWVCSVFAVLDAVFSTSVYAIAALGIMGLSCTAGFWWPVKSYGAIEKKYKVNQEKT